MPRRRKAYSRSTVLEEEEEAMEEEVAAEEEDDDVEDGDEDGDDDEDDGGSKGGRGQGGGRERPGQRNAANARERARMRVLSRAFCRLKTTLPWVPPDTKLSKLDTLRLATSYIAHLRAMLAAEAESAASVETSAKGAPVGEESPDRGRVSTLHPLNLTWPFSFQRTSSSSSSPASSTSSNVSASLTGGQTAITSLGDEWSSVHGMQSNHYCQDNHMAMDTRGPQNCVSPPSHHHILHHHHPHHFLPSSYPDSSLLHIA